jgi:hypothetical protein
LLLQVFPCRFHYCCHDPFVPHRSSPAPLLSQLVQKPPPMTSWRL